MTTIQVKNDCRQSSAGLNHFAPHYPTTVSQSWFVCILYRDLSAKLNVGLDANLQLMTDWYWVEIWLTNLFSLVGAYNDKGACTRTCIWLMIEMRNSWAYILARKIGLRAQNDCKTSTVWLMGVLWLGWMLACNNRTTAIHVKPDLRTCYDISSHFAAIIIQSGLCVHVP